MDSSVICTVPGIGDSMGIDVFVLHRDGSENRVERIATALQVLEDQVAKACHKKSWACSLEVLRDV